MAFDPGPGMCALDASQSEFDRLVLDWQRKTQAGTNYLVGMYAECSRLNRARDGQEVDLGQYGILLVVNSGAAEPKPISGYRRSEFLSEVSRAMRGGVPLDAGKISERSFNALDDALRQAVGEIQIGQVRQLGELARDEAAVYVGYLMSVQTNAGEQMVAGASGLTLVKSYPLQYSLYRGFVDESSFALILDDLQPIMRNLVTKNEPLGERTQGLPGVVPAGGANDGLFQRLHWALVGKAATIGAVVGAIVAGLIGFKRLVFGRRKSGHDGGGRPSDEA